MTTLATVMSGYAGTATTVNTVIYIYLIGYDKPQTSESSTYATVQEAGTFQNFYATILSNAISGGTSTFVMRDNSLSVNESLSVGASASGEFEDTINQDTITAGHKYNIMFTPGDTTHTLTYLNFRTLFNTTTNTATRMANYLGAQAYTAASTTYYFAGTNGVSPNANTTESLVKARQRLAGTMQNMFVNVFSNTRSVACTVNSRLDTGSGSNNGNMTKSITASGSGMFEDTVNIDTVAAGNDYNFSFTTGSDTGHSITMMLIGNTFLSTTGYTYYQTTDTVTPNSTSIWYYALGGRLFNMTEAKAQTKAGENKKFSQMTINLSANSTGTGTMSFRVAGANGKQAVSVSASSTGNMTDTSNVDYVTPSQEINYSYVCGASSGVTIQFMEVWAVKGYSYGETETTSISESKARKVTRRSQPIFVHIYN